MPRGVCGQLTFFGRNLLRAQVVSSEGTRKRVLDQTLPAGWEAHVSRTTGRTYLSPPRRARRVPRVRLVRGGGRGVSD